MKASVALAVLTLAKAADNTSPSLYPTLDKDSLMPTLKEDSFPIGSLIGLLLISLALGVCVVYIESIYNYWRSRKDGNPTPTQTPTARQGKARQGKARQGKARQ